MPDISKRGAGLIREPAVPAYVGEHFDRAADAWSPDNPGGYIGLSIAENKLGFDLLHEKMAASRDVAPEVLAYDAFTGSEKFRTQLAAFLSRHIVKRRIEAGDLAILAGAGTVLEILFYVLGDPGDGVLVPTPSYSGFWPDLETRDELRIVPAPMKSDTGFALSTELLDQALEEADVPVRALLFTSPSNPLGVVYSRAELETVIDWALHRDMHIVFDEIFALSVYGDSEFVSAAEIRPHLGEGVHVVWAFSKDFGMSGLRAGVLLSENRDVMGAIEQLAYWGACSGDTQHVLGELISDEPWVDEYIRANQARLRDAYRRTAQALDGMRIPYIPAEAGHFVVCDFRPFMSEVTWQEEDRLWRRLLTEAGVNLTPGAQCRIEEPGFMRLVFPAVPPEAVEAGVDRIGKLLGQAPGGR